MHRPLQFLFIVVMAVASVACESGVMNGLTPDPSFSRPPDPSFVSIEILTEPQPSQACMEALATGTLVPVPQSGLGLRASDGSTTPVMWPFGYTARLADNVVELYDANGQYVATEGDLIEMGGGSGANGLFYACGGTVRAAR